MKRTANISYLSWGCIGVFFIFSALAKSLDIFGVAAVIEDYCIALQMTFTKSIYEIFAFLLIGVEFLCGLLMLIRMYKTYVFFCVIGLLTLFGFLTLYIAITNKLNDCGCFGSVMVVTPWMSFAKNCILVLLAVAAYPQIRTTSKVHYSKVDLIICIIFPILLCVVSAFNQPLFDSTNLGIGDKLNLNTESQNSIDIEFSENFKGRLYNFGMVRKFDQNTISELMPLLYVMNEKPTIITSSASRDVPSFIKEQVNIGLIDNMTLNNMLSTDWGIMCLDSNNVITGKWQKDFLNLQFYKTTTNVRYTLDKFLYILVWILSLAISIYYTILYIKRGCRKTYQRVGTKTSTI